MTNYPQCFVVLCLIFLTSKIAITVKINRLVVPDLVHLGEPTVLDCDYRMEDEEERELVLKWYLNEKLVYQWIPSTKPHTLGILKGRVNLNYSASSDTNSVHRALNIIQPGPDLSGDYTCLVSTFTSEDRQTKRMLVFAPGKDMQLKKETKRNGLVEISCSAKDVFPQPTMNLHVNNSEVDNSTLSIVKRSGLYNVRIATEMPALTTAEEFTCKMYIPLANYTVRKEAIYYPAGTAVGTSGEKTKGKT